jgi:hypothetical protein
MCTGEIMKLLTLFLVSLGALAQSSSGSSTQENIFTNIINMSQTLGVVLDEVECIDNAKRQHLRIAINSEGYPGSGYIGQSSYGDIAIVTSSEDGDVMDIFACERSEGVKMDAAQLTSFVLEMSDLCPVDQISYGYIRLKVGDSNHAFDAGFAPISVPGSERKSSLCVQKENKSITDKSRGLYEDEVLSRIPVETVNVITQ